MLTRRAPEQAINRFAEHETCDRLTNAHAGAGNDRDFVFLIVLLAFAYLEEDGVLFGVALVFTLALLPIASGIIWQTMRAAGWVPALF